MHLLQIDRDTLIEIHDLLNSSADQEISINDEISYFDSEKPKSWFVVKDVDGRNMGFVRSFPQDTDWSLGELYIVNKCKDRRQAARVLLESFARHVTFEIGHRLRFDVRAADSDLNEELISLGFSQKRQTFLHFQKTTSPLATLSEHPQRPSLSQASQVAEVLSFLNPVTEAQVHAWIKRDKIRICVEDSKIASAAQIANFETSIEIVRIATHAEFLRQGHASKLIRQILSEASEAGKSSVHLKVENIRAPAIATYIKLGFIEDAVKSQIWHSRWY